MAEDQYSSHKDQLVGAHPPKLRVKNLNASLQKAFAENITTKPVDYIQFRQISSEQLAEAFVAHPLMVKSILACVNVASRAIARDLNITLDTYADRIPRDKALAVAKYIKPMLPDELSITAIAELDRWFWTDKELRASKGNWERRITTHLNNNASVTFQKTKFKTSGEEFELDAAYPVTGQIEVGIDVKRIESPRDIHKRSDEIINKASKFKVAFPKNKFYVVVYYPFPDQHDKVLSRLKNEYIDAVYFADESEDTLRSTAISLLKKSGLFEE